MLRIPSQGKKLQPKTSLESPQKLRLTKEAMEPILRRQETKKNDKQTQQCTLLEVAKRKIDME